MRIFVLLDPTIRQNAMRAIAEAPDGYEVRIRERSRSLEQNAAMWAALTDISEQVVWHGQKLTPEDWKHILTAGLKREQRVAPGIGGGFVVLGQSTRKMTKSEFSELLEFCYAFGAEHEVKFELSQPETA
jgi:hypothetical protein